MRLVNVNFPVPYAAITGVEVTNLADRSDLELPLFDRNLGFPPLLPGVPTPNCASIADGQACSVGVGVVFPAGPDAVKKADTDAHHANKISITPMDGDMTASGLGGTKDVFGGLTP